MNVLLDTNILINLDYIQETRLIERMHRNHGWKFYVPKAVVTELNRKPIERSIQYLLDDEIISIKECSEMEISNSRLKTLGSGEYEAVCIISQCLDKTYKGYLLLTSDRRARKITDKLGINSGDVLNFMLLCNKKGQISKGDAILACNRLRTSYCMDDKVIKEFVEHLQNI